MKAPPNPNTGTPRHAPPPLFNKTTMRTKGGHQHADGRVSITAPALPSPCHPTAQCHPTIHNAPTHHHEWGRANGGCPTTQRNTETRTTHTPHTRQGTVRNMIAVPMSTALGWAGHGAHHWTRRTSTAHATAIPLDTPRRRRTPSTHPLALFALTQSMIDRDQR